MKNNPAAMTQRCGNESTTNDYAAMTNNYMAMTNNYAAMTNNLKQVTRIRQERGPGACGDDK